MIQEYDDSHTFATEKQLEGAFEKDSNFEQALEAVKLEGMNIKGKRNLHLNPYQRGTLETPGKLGTQSKLFDLP